MVASTVVTKEQATAPITMANPVPSLATGKSV
jgi:hypothetical protein